MAMTNEAKLAGCHADLVRKVLAVISDLKGHGMTAVVTCGKRTQAQQDALYAQGRTKPGAIVTKVRHSNHQDGTAADLAFVVRGRITWDVPPAWWDMLGHAAECHGLTWGGRWTWPDRPHVELP